MSSITHYDSKGKPSSAQPEYGKSTFHTRLAAAVTFEEKVQQYFKNNLGITLHPWGLGTMTRDARQTLIQCDSAAARHIRYQPDFFFHLRTRNDVIYADAKTSISKTGNYAICVEQFNELCGWRTRGMHTIYLFPPSKYPGPLLAAHIDQIDGLKSRVVADQKELAQVNGSRRPFLIIPESKLPHIEELIQDMRAGDIW